MKNLLFYTLHRQYDEIEYSSYFFNKNKFLKQNFEVIVHCNNQNRTLQELKNKCKFNTKTEIILTTKNNGYSSGHIEALCDNFELFKKYDYCIHLHPDCYITNDIKLQNIFKDEFDYAVSPSFHMNRMCYSTDFFVFKPNLNIFNNYEKIWKSFPNTIPEYYFYDIIKNDMSLKIKILDRYPNLNGTGFRTIDNFDLWHEHDNEKVLRYIQNAV